MEQNVTMEFTVQELTALQQLLHRALLQSGMEVAEAAVLLNQKIQRALLAFQQEVQSRSD